MMSNIIFIIVQVSLLPGIHLFKKDDMLIVNISY